MRLPRLPRWLFVALGFLATALGIIGVVLPVLPATPFLLLASLCYAHGSERLDRWLRAHPVLGPRLARLREGGGLTAREKIGIYVFAACLIAPVIVFCRSVLLKVLLALLLAAKAVVFLRIKTAPPQVRQRSRAS